ncbi:unnamed protein product, partial [Schistosoma haematobium]
MSLSTLTCKKNDGGCADNMSTYSDKCVSVVPAVMRRLKEPTSTDGKVKSSLTLTRRVVPPDTNIGNHAPPVETEDLDKTVTALNSHSVLRDEKWTTKRIKLCVVHRWLASHWSNPTVSHKMHYRNLIVRENPTL